MRRWTQSFICNGSIEGCEIDGTHRLRAQHKRIVTYAFAVNVRLDREIAKAIKTRLRCAFDPAIEQMHGREIARVLKRAAQREDTASPTIIVFRGPVILLAHATAADGANGR